MKVEKLIAILDELAPEDLDRVEAYLARQDKRRQENQTVQLSTQAVDQENQTQRDNGRQMNREKVIADLDAAIDEFWGDSSEEEMRAIFDAMRTKSSPAKKVL